MKRIAWGVSVVCLLSFAACGEDAQQARAVEGCIPGASQACTGPGGCEGGQICAADGKSFAACDCSTGDGGPGSGAGGGAGGSTNLGAGGDLTGTGGSTGAGGDATTSGGATSAGGGTSTGGGSSTGGATGSTCVGGNVVQCGNGTRDPGEICYRPPRLVPFAGTVTEGPSMLEVADLDTNGRDEVVLVMNVGTPGPELRVLSADAGGTWSEEPPVPCVGCGHPVALGEVTGDTLLDAVVARTNDFAVLVAPGTSSGSLGPTVEDADWGGYYGPMELTDVDADGNPDAVFLSLGTVAIRERGSSAPLTSITTPQRLGSLRMVDVTGDGRPDIVGGGNALSFGINDGNGLFSFWSTYAEATTVNRPQTEQLDSDGLLDVVYGGATAEVRIYRGNGFGGVIGDSTPHAVAGGAVSVAFPLDVTSDGCPDIVAFHAGGIFSILPALGDGSFDTYRAYPGMDGAAVDIETGDFNGDDVPDFVGLDTQDPPRGLVVVLSNP